MGGGERNWELVKGGLALLLSPVLDVRFLLFLCLLTHAKGRLAASLPTFSSLLRWPRRSRRGEHVRTDRRSGSGDSATAMERSGSLVACAFARGLSLHAMARSEFSGRGDGLCDY